MLFINHDYSRQKEFSNKSVFQNIDHDDSAFFYIKVKEEEKGDLGATGSLNLFDIKVNKSYVIDKEISVTTTKAFITTNGNIAVVTMNGISILNKSRKPIKKINFNPGDEVVGVDYFQQKESIFFLLKNDKNNKIDLCQFMLKNYEVKKLKINFNIKIEDEEEPYFLKFHFTTNNKLLIENTCNSVLSVDLYGEYNTHLLTFTNKPCSIGCDMQFNNDGIIYSRYIDKNNSVYEVKQYSLSNGKVQKLIDGKSVNAESVLLAIYANPVIPHFVIGSSNKFYVYDYKSFKELKIDKNSDIVFVAKNAVYYLNKQGNVNSVKF